MGLIITVTSIGNNLFYYYFHLEQINIQSSITSIGSYAFSGCNFN